MDAKDDAAYQRAKFEVARLVDKYQHLKDSGRLKDQGESDTKKDFITPLFRILGWDVENDRTPDEVTNEDPASKGRVDYAFRINSVPKFLLEAKALNKGIDETKDSKQAINYAWYKGVTWAVLTDFANLMVYNAEVKDKNISEARFMWLGCGQFADHFEKLWLLSKQSFEQGLLDKEAEGWGKKKRKVKPNEQLLADITHFRELLSKNIKKNNLSQNLSQLEIEEAVQKILDRLIFIRAAEDRKFMDIRLLPAVREFETRKRGKLTDALNMIYRSYDDKFDSKLFTQNNPKERHLCETVNIDDDVLTAVIKGLHESLDGVVTYDFDLIDEDILGSMYEQYLAHILRTTEKRAQLEHKVAHRKEQGIYYTPAYIVNYIVQNTLGECVKGKSPSEVSKIRVLDPACGSGSFLTKSFKYLEKWHQKNDSEYAKAYAEARNGGPATPHGRILQSNIFGVDLDARAVEIAQLSLLISAMDDKGRLPTLQENIKNGNSLIDDASVAGDKAFVWEKEFASVMKDGGFDAIVGNPPWVSFGLRGVQTLDEREDAYYRAKYDSAEYKLSIYAMFIERGIRNLGPGGRISFIVPDSFLLGRYFSKLRHYVLKNCYIKKIVFTEYDVFVDKATTGRNVIIVLERKGDGVGEDSGVQVKRCRSPADFNSKAYDFVYSQDYFESLPYTRFRLFFNKHDFSIVKKMDKVKDRLGDFLVPYSGCIGRYGQDSIMSDDKKNTIRIFDKNEKLVYDDDDATKKWKPLLPSSSCIRKYRLNVQEKKYIYIEPDQERRRIYAKSGFDLEKYQSEKLFMPQTGDSLTATYVAEELYCINNLHVLTRKKGSGIDIKYLLGLINSKLFNYYYHTISLEYHRTMAQTDIETVEKLPIAEAPVEKQKIMIGHVERMLELNQKLNEFGDKQTSERDKLEKEIQETDKQIDALVYGLYGLTQEEIKIVEDALR